LDAPRFNGRLDNGNRGWLMAVGGADARALPAGTMVAGAWRIGRVLGQGGFGVTYAAEGMRSGTHAALKEFMPTGLCTRPAGSTAVVPAQGPAGEVFARGLAGFIKEAETLGRLNHPSIVRALAHFSANGTAYLALEMIAGGALSTWLRGLGRPPSQAECDALLWPLTDALTHVHALFLLHRDIKPENIMLKPDGTPVLIDFGAAKSLVMSETRTIGAPATLNFVTDGYAPPEQYAPEGEGLLGPWTDVYALGATFYQAVTGIRPPSGAYRQIEDTLKPLLQSDMGPAWRPTFLAGINRALALRRADRPQSAMEFRQAMGVPEPGSVRPETLTTALAPTLAAGTAALAHASGPQVSAPGASGPRPSAPRASGPKPASPAAAPITFSALPSGQDAAATAARPARRGAWWAVGVLSLIAMLLAFGAVGFQHPPLRAWIETAFGVRVATPPQPEPGDRERVAAAEWARLTKTKDEQALSDFIERYRGTEAAQRAAEVLARWSAAAELWERLKGTTDLGIIERFLEAHGDTPAAAEASGRRGALRNQMAAEAWDSLKSGRDEQAVQRFIETWTDTPSAGVARARLAALIQDRKAQEAREQRAAAEWTAIKDTADKALLERFFAAHAGTEAAKAALLRLRDPVAALKPGSGESARDRLADGRECAFCPEMVVVPAGSFMMGSSPGEIAALKTELPDFKDWFDKEAPQRGVAIREPFAVAKYEVKFAEWDACVADGGCTHKPDDQGWGRGRRPVINVSWRDAKGYVAWLSRKTGKTYRLLSEAEWEYAACAGTTTRYFWGNKFSNARANNDTGRTVEVGLYGANAWGLHDMHGNVWEWVEDCWHDSYNGAPSDGSAWSTSCSDQSRRILRGGSWYNHPGLLRSAYRGSYSTDNRDYGVGFRLARTLSP
jgi:formylglycine-generating enzyme required for sulfatase activity/serine/threonine protein kinase